MANQSLYGGEETVRFNLLLKKSHYEALQELGGHEGKSVAALIRDLITDFLRDENDGQDAPAGRKK